MEVNSTGSGQRLKVSPPWGETYQQPVRGACQSAVVVDTAVEDSGLLRHALLGVHVHDVPGFHVERPENTHDTCEAFNST